MREKNKKFCLGYVDFEVPINHPSGSSQINKPRVQARIQRDSFLGVTGYSV